MGGALVPLKLFGGMTMDMRKLLLTACLLIIGPVHAKTMTMKEATKYCIENPDAAETGKSDAIPLNLRACAARMIAQKVERSTCVRDPAGNEPTCNHEARMMVAKHHGFNDMPHASMSSTIDLA